MHSENDHTADYKVLSVLTKAMIAGILLFSVISLLIHFVNGAFIHDQHVSNTVFVILLLLAIVLIEGARFIYNKRINSLMRDNQTGKEKLNIFRAITITHMALCEVPALLCIIFFICFGNFLLFLPVGMALVEMIKKFPTQQRIDSAVNSGTF